MNAMIDHLFKSLIWLSSFAVVYSVFLKDERFFTLKRYFLLLGLVSAIVFPAITFKYLVPTPETISEPISIGKQIIHAPIKIMDKSMLFQDYALLVYVAGLFVFLSRAIWQVVIILLVIKKSKADQGSSYWLIESTKFQSSFSFFSYVFVNPSVDKAEMQEILKHEAGHISQKHWLDLLLFEVVLILQWFNPVVWLYGRLIRQNHEYLADNYALQRTENPAFYKATLLNQLMGAQVLTLTNSFNYSLNKKRFNMMTYKNQSPIRKLRLLIILPAIASIFYAFSEPDYVLEIDNTKHIEASDTLKQQENKLSIRSIIWHNNTVFSSEQLTKELGIKPGEKISDQELNHILNEKIYSLYLDKGYLFFNAQMQPKTQNEHKYADIEIKIYEGQIYKVRNIRFKGKYKKSDEELKKILLLEEGEVFNRDNLNKSVHALSKKLKMDFTADLNPITDELKVDILFQIN